GGRADRGAGDAGAGGGESGIGDGPTPGRGTGARNGDRLARRQVTMSCSPDLKFGELNESRAEVALAWSDADGVREVAATLHGPHCKFARTLPVEFSFDALAAPDGQVVAQT